MSESGGFDADKAMKQIKGDSNLKLVALGAAAAIVGLFLPWVQVDLGFGLGSLSVDAGLDTETNGLYVFILSLVALGASLNVMGREMKQMRQVALGSSILAALLVLLKFESGDGISIGFGYILSLAGTIVMAYGAWRLYSGGASKASSGGGDAEA